MDETSKVMPNWMQIKIEKDKLKDDTMRSSQYNSHVSIINILYLYRIKE
jgi:hypothetical protein